MQTAGGHMQRLRAPNNQKLHAKRARAVTSFKAARVYASMSLRPIGITKVEAQLRDAHCESTLGTWLSIAISHRSVIRAKVQTRHRTHATIPSDRISIRTDIHAMTVLLASVCKKRLKKEDLNVYCNIHCGKLIGSLTM